MSVLLGVALAVLGAAGLGVVTEVGVRAALGRWGGYYRYRPHRRERHELDPEAIPGSSPPATVEINAVGERGDPVPRAGERVYRALVVGGSAAECYLLDQSATWSAAAQRILSGPEQLAALGVSRVHIGNVSRAILPCDQIAFMLSKILPRYPRLDALLVMVGGADVVTWIERGMPATVPPGRIVLDKIFEYHPEGPWGWTPRRTALWRIAGQLNRQLRRPIVFHANGGRWMRRVRKMRADAPHRIDEVPDASGMLDHFERNLGALIAAARVKVDRVILVRQPWFGPNPTPEEERLFWNFGLGRPYREEVDTYLTPRAIDEVMRRMDERAVAVAGALGVEHVDVGSRLERSSRTFYDELHFTTAGAESVGRIVADAILAPAQSAGPRVVGETAIEG